MKKLLLSVLVLGAFFVYGLHEKNEASEAKVIPPTPGIKPTDSANAGQLDTPTTAPTIGQSALPTHSAGQAPTPTPTSALGYKDGIYAGNVADAFYGNIQVKAIIAGGKITDVQFLQYPNDRSTSIEINQQAMPFLKQEAIQAQSANVDIISGATDSSRAFRESLQSALDQAKA